MDRAQANIPDSSFFCEMNFTRCLLQSLAVAALFLIATTPAAAQKTDILVLDNGDRITCEIKQLEYDRRLLTTTRDSMQEAYRGQIRQAANRQRAGQQVEEKIALDINELQTRLAENSRSLDYMEIREVDIRAEFGKQLERYRFLEEKWAEESEDS